MTASSVRLRFFASARAALGADEIDVPVGGEVTIADAIAHAPGAESADAVLARCSFLVNGIATTDRTTPLVDGDLVDVMPPFAGG